ncbi:MAG: putative 4-hydroxybenzoate polyprenyltransferase [Chloroflexota bacterium]|nr:putative 4-hydroxybenzoate polyprenyltransferase [Chloroflexota bacterium]MDE2839009.1 putative 4-hydroxybenzoate polyprenyltransferase [Chloroflexota bacterium]MDE2929709.1 putative 4-hydroxybenzoate polyprenyltransferase [Chloroflexota bacterium]
MSATSTSMGSVMRKVPVFLEAIKIEHAAFTLPFAYLAMLLAAEGLPTWWQFIWVTVAMTAGRTAAMSLNRIIDRHLDSRNPRTAIRALPRGILTPQFMWGASIFNLALMVFAAAMLNWLCVLLSPIAIFWLVFYSYTKRFTWLSHFALGVSGSMAPMGGWIAVTGEFAWSTVLLGAAVVTWMAGFDMIYACQDYEIDLKEGLFSIPARFGIPRALIFSALSHAATALCLAAVGALLDLGLFYWLGIAAVAGLLIWEHLLVNPRDLSRINTAFFHVNSSLSAVFFVFVALETFLGIS